jgi:hypothetical protein
MAVFDSSQRWRTTLTKGHQLLGNRDQLKEPIEFSIARTH